MSIAGSFLTLFPRETAADDYFPKFGSKMRFEQTPGWLLKKRLIGREFRTLQMIRPSNSIERISGPSELRWFRLAPILVLFGSWSLRFLDPDSFFCHETAADNNFADGKIENNICYRAIPITQKENVELGNSMGR